MFAGSEPKRSIICLIAFVTTPSSVPLRPNAQGQSQRLDLRIKLRNSLRRNAKRHTALIGDDAVAGREIRGPQGRGYRRR